MPTGRRLTERACKHLLALKLFLKQERPPAPAGVPTSEPSEPVKRPTYKQDWPNYNKAQTREKGHVLSNELYCKLIAWNLTCLVHAIYELGVVRVFWQDGPDDGPRDVIRFPTSA